MPPERILIITYLFPPCGGVGVQRVFSHTRYLPQNNCEVFVLTARNPATPVYDYPLAKQVSSETKVFRAFNPEVSYEFRDRLWKRILPGQSRKATEPSACPAPATPPAGSIWKSLAKGVIQQIFSPDVQVVWVPFAIRAARRIITRHKITTVLVNLPPFSPLYVAVALKRRFPDLRLILDFRDEWIDNYLAQLDSAANEHKLRLALKLERRAIEAADFVVAVTRAQLGQIRRRYPEQPDGKFLYVPNGFHPDLFANIHPRRAPDSKMVVTHFGTVYANVACRPILNYLEAVDSLPEHVRARIESRFIGRVAREAEWFFESRRHSVRRFGFMNKEAALPLLEESDYNIMASANPTTHGGKLFDYLGLGIPILALCDANGEMGQVIRETHMGWCADPLDLADIRRLLLFAFERLERGGTDWNPNREAIREYEWPSLVASLARRTGMGSAARAVPNPASPGR